MPRQLRGGDLISLGEFLIESAQEVPTDPAEWEAIVNARHRNAIGRGYYAAFLTLKSRCEGTRAGWKLPQKDVHHKIRRALETILGSDHLLVKNMRDLFRSRSEADYALTNEFLKKQVEDVLDIAHETATEIEQLDTTTVTKIVGELIDLDRAR